MRGTNASERRSPAHLKDSQVGYIGGQIMKYFVSMLSIASALALTSPAFAGEGQAECEAVGGTWNADTQTCTK